MKVLLTKAVSKLGLPGDVKDVKDGYARNYLLPQGYAVLTIDPKAKAIRASLTADRAKAESARASAQRTATDWAGKTIAITASATADGTLFGSVSAKDVAAKLGLDLRAVTLPTIKETGSYEVRVDVGAGVDAIVNLEVKAGKAARKSRA